LDAYLVDAYFSRQEAEMNELRKKFVVVGAGQIGTLLAARLVKHGAVNVVSRNACVLPEGVVHVSRDVATTGVSDVVAGAHTVFIAVNAPYNAAAWAKTLPAIQENVVAACVSAGCRLVVLENLYVHGPSIEPLRQDMPSSCTTQKGAVRQRMTEALFAHKDELRVASVRPPDFWGPGLTSAVLDDKAVAGILKGRAAQALGDTDAPHARAFADDVAAAMVAIALDDSADVWGRVWHPPVIHVSTRELVTALASAARVKDPGVRSLPRWALAPLGLFIPILREMIEMFYMWDRPYLVDDSVFRRRFAMAPTSLADGAAITVRQTQP
jgi:nucleoside-diphosphate-sugar epimerase